MAKIKEILLRYQDEKYGDFLSKIVPNIPRTAIIGIRSPVMKKVIKEVHAQANDEIPAFLEDLPHQFQEENYLHIMLISEIKDFDEFMVAFEKFLPHINNWAVSDGINPKVLQNNHARLLPYIQKWLQSDLPYTKRVGLLLIMKYFLEDDFKPEYLEWAAVIRSEEYYVNMMIAWLFAEALARQWDDAIVFITTNKLDTWTHNKAIQKARESNKIPDEQKAYLKGLKRK